MMDAAKLPGSWQRLHDDARHRRAVTRKVRALVGAKRRLVPAESAKVADLHYVSDERTPGFKRLGRQRPFHYVDARGRPITNRAVRQRIDALGIPPAWTDVWICPDPRGHLQATGRDARGRKQYRYHPRWREVRDEVKYGRLLTFASALPRIHVRTAADLRRPGLTREKVIAAVVRLLEKTLIRVGNEEYAKANGSVGLTTMRDRHARVNGARVRFEFRGKSGVRHAIDLEDRQLAAIVKACRDLPGQELFQYLDHDGGRQVIGSADVNAYLREACGEPFTSKDFRTWAGTVLAARQLAAAGLPRSAAHAKRNIVRAVECVAERLGNTKAVCRKSYIHPAVFDAHLAGSPIAGDASAVVALIRRYLQAVR